MRSGAKFVIGQTVGWWGCASCGSRVGNNHTGPCARCGGRIGRIVPNVVRLDADLGVKFPVREAIPKVQEPPPPDWTNVALVAAAVSCFGAPLLGAANAGWNAVAVVMAVNIWASSISYYALAIVGRREQRPA